MCCEKFIQCSFLASADMAIKIRIVYYYEVFMRNSLRGNNILGLKYRVKTFFGVFGFGAF